MKKTLFAVFQKISLALSGTGIAKNKYIYSFYQSLLSRLKPRIVTTEGSKMILDAQDSLLLSIYPNFEPGETEIVKKFIKKGMRVVDAGANIGYFTLLMAQLVGKSGKVHAFEPGHENIELLKKNVTLNKRKNVIVNETALSNKVGDLNFYLSASNPQDHRIIKDKHEKRKTYKVKSITLDEYFKNGKVDFIKMDIQGAELLALEGAIKIISKYKPLLIIEYWPYGIVQLGRKPEELFKILEKMKYKIMLINQSNGKLEQIHKKNLLTKSSSGDIYNFFCKI